MSEDINNKESASEDDVGRLHRMITKGFTLKCGKQIKKALKKKDGKVTLVGFGTFAKVRRKARKGVNPATGEKINIKARNAVKFTPGKALKEAV